MPDTKIEIIGCKWPNRAALCLWLTPAAPVLIALGVTIGDLAARSLFEPYACQKIIPALFQVAGALVVVWGINANASLTGKGLWSLCKNWLKHAPFLRRNIIISVSDSLIAGDNVELKVQTQTGDTVEQKVDYLLREVATLRQEIETQRRDFQESLATQKKELAGQVEAVQRKSEDNMQKLVVDGVPLQIAGILSAIYGTLIAVL